MFDLYVRRLDLFGADGADVPTLRARFERFAPKVPFWYGIRTSPAEVGGVSGEWVETGRSAHDQVLLYLHGGGWFMGSPRTHRSIVADLVRISGIRGLTLDYRLAPEHPYPAALDDCVAAYEGLLASGIARAGSYSEATRPAEALPSGSCCASATPVVLCRPGRSCYPR